MPSDYRPRFSFDITTEQQQRVNKLLKQHGMIKALFQPILDDVLDLLEEHGNIVAGIIMDRRAKPREVMPILSEADRRGSK